MIKKITFFILVIFFTWISIVRTDGFSTKQITRFDDGNKQLNIDFSGNMSEVKSILSQNFHYLTRGRECFIFESEDKKYVIKFFDATRYNSKIFFPSIPLPKFLDALRQKHYNRRITKLEFNLTSAKLAFENLKDESALVYVNTSKTDIFQNDLVITNKCKKSFSLDLNDIFFILQKKCDIFYESYEKSQDDKHKIELLYSFLEMVDTRTKKNIIDDDLGTKRRNWGLYNDKAVTIDIGRWYFDEKLKTPKGYKKEMLKATKILRRYLEKNDVEKLIIVNELLDKYFNDFEKSYQANS
ncbi:MAG: hypothetical protein WCT85_01650 [Parachlamydiales bacterium]|jgi:hypothetical protein